MTSPSDTGSARQSVSTGGTAGGATHGEQLAALWRMTAAQRVAAMRRGALSLAQLRDWYAKAPREGPLIGGITNGGELPWIAARDPNYCEADRS